MGRSPLLSDKLGSAFLASRASTRAGRSWSTDSNNGPRLHAIPNTVKMITTQADKQKAIVQEGI